MSCAPHCCPGPHLLITICHLSCAPHTLPSTLLSYLLPYKPHYSSSTCPLPPSCWFHLIPLSPPDLLLQRFSSQHSSLNLLSFCVVLCPAPVPFPDVFYLHLHLQLLHSFFSPSCARVLLSFHGMVSILSGFSPWNPHFNSASTPRLSKPSHIGK